jgi:hypothetical protein
LTELNREMGEGATILEELYVSSSSDYQILFNEENMFFCSYPNNSCIKIEQ